MLRPSKRALTWLAVGLPVAALPALIAPELWLVWASFNGVILLLLGLDAAFSPATKHTRVQVKLPSTMYLGTEAEVQVAVRLQAGGRVAGREVETRCDLTGPVEFDDELRLRTDASGVARGTFVLSPARRGPVRCTAAWVRVAGPLGLVTRLTRVEVDAECPVIPDIHAVRQAALQMSRSRNFIVGLKRQRYIGDGTEFESLREFQPGYDHRAIDWKASARQRKLLVREFEAERNHRIVLAFDTGYLMAQPVEGVPRLDHAIQAGLLLALLSLKQGDRVGVFGFDEEVRTWLPPQGGMPTLHRLMGQSAALEYASAETNFTRGLAELSARLRRRSIVVVLTDFADTITAEQMVSNLGRLARRHLVLFVSVRDPTIGQLATTNPPDFEALNQAVVAGDFVRDREIVLGRLRRHGIFCIDAPPAEITVQLLNRYLEVKRRGLV